jgi:hypothetical protein
MININKYSRSSIVFKEVIAMVGLYLISLNSYAAYSSVDWKSQGDNLITRLTLESGVSIEYLDLTVTTNRSFVDIKNEMRGGGELEGWSFTGTQYLEIWW